MLAPGRFPIAFHLRREFKEKLQNNINDKIKLEAQKRLRSDLSE